MNQWHFIHSIILRIYIAPSQETYSQFFSTNPYSTVMTTIVGPVYMYINVNQLMKALALLRRLKCVELLSTSLTCKFIGVAQAKMLSEITDTSWQLQVYMYCIQ